MRWMFSVVGLLVVVAIVGIVAKQQLHALGGLQAGITSAASAALPGTRDGATLPVPGGVAGATAADTTGLTVPQVSQQMQQQMKDAVTQAMQPPAARGNDGQ